MNQSESAAASRPRMSGTPERVPSVPGQIPTDGVASTEAGVRAAYAERAGQTWRIAETLYPPNTLAGLPQGAISSALGLDDPVGEAHLQPGETVLDIGCGGGIDTLLAAQAVGPAGRAVGLDLTEELLALARANAAALGLTNTRFIQGDMAALPLPDASVDVVISNGVFNLATDKDAVFREARRVVRLGGRLIVADMLLGRELPASVRENPRLWSG